MALTPVLHSFGYGVDFLAEQVADVAPEAMTAQPNGMRNHPSWTIGHLTFACQRLGGAIGLAPWLPADWTDRFGPGSEPVADVAFYPTKETALAMLRDAETRIASGANRLDESQLNAVFPDESVRDVFPTILHALTQVLVGHTSFHVGQVSVWRAAMGLPRMGRSFE